VWKVTRGVRAASLAIDTGKNRRSMCTTRRSIVYHLVDDRSARHAGLIALAAGVAATVPKIIETRIAIKASPSKVWSILTNFSAMPSWNPFITAISGNVLLGTRLS
jgi:hypothetical protein